MWKETQHCSTAGFISRLRNTSFPNLRVCSPLPVFRPHSLSAERPWRWGLVSSAEPLCKEKKSEKEGKNSNERKNSISSPAGCKLAGLVQKIIPTTMLVIAAPHCFTPSFFFLCCFRNLEYSKKKKQNQQPSIFYALAMGNSKICYAA